MENYGLEWPYPVSWLVLGSILYLFFLVLHTRKLFRSTIPSEAWKLTVLRGVCALLLLLLVARPFVDHFDADPRSARVVSLIDFSGSMNRKDPGNDNSRIEQVRPFFDLGRKDSWINQSRSRYRSVERLGFSGDEIFPVRSSSWTKPESGASTLIGDALIHILEQKDVSPPSAVVLFSDGRNNSGKSPLQVGEKFREIGLPIHVVGVGESSEFGNLSISFLDLPDYALAKEEITFRAQVKNEFDHKVKTTARLYMDEKEIDSLSITLAADTNQTISFPPVTPEVGGFYTFRVAIDPPNGDFDPSDDVDAQIIEVRPPEIFSALYISNQINQLYPFLKRSLAHDRFQLSSLIRLGPETFHVRGENIPTNGYPEDADFWMEYDVVLADAACLDELNSTLLKSLKKFVENRGGGLALLGHPGKSREHLGGLMPAVETEYLMSRQNLSLLVFSDPLFTEARGVNEWKPFLPAGLPAHLITRINPAARSVVSLRSDLDRSILTLQAYGAGKSAYWGSPHDWRRALSSEDQAKEFSRFWQGVVEWLGSGTVERIKVLKSEEFGTSGESNPLRLEVLGADFQPSVDASIEANITGSEGFSKNVQLYPSGASLGTYTGNFTPHSPGSYEIVYHLTFPDGEKLQKFSYLKVREFGEEAKDARYAEKDLRTLANLTGGTFLPVNQLNDSWDPPLSDSLPVISQRTQLADGWTFFLFLFLAAGLEWFWRRKGGFR